VQVRVRLGAGLSSLAAAPMVTVQVPEDGTVGDVVARLRDAEPELAPALDAALPVVAGEHVRRDHRLAHRQELALLLPMSGG
jgi:molybdopterin converting factor small subunit